jgi:hypothetical protein
MARPNRYNLRDLGCGVHLSFFRIGSMLACEVKKHCVRRVFQEASHSNHGRTQRNATANLRRTGREMSAGTLLHYRSLSRRKGMK